MHTNTNAPFEFSYVALNQMQLHESDTQMNSANYLQAFKSVRCLENDKICGFK